MLRNGEDISYKRQQIAKYVEKTGIGHSLVEIKLADEYDDDDILINDEGEYIGSCVRLGFTIYILRIS